MGDIEYIDNNIACLCYICLTFSPVVTKIITYTLKTFLIINLSIDILSCLFLEEDHI